MREQLLLGRKSRCYQEKKKKRRVAQHRFSHNLCLVPETPQRESEREIANKKKKNAQLCLSTNLHIRGDERARIKQKHLGIQQQRKVCIL